MLRMEKEGDMNLKPLERPSTEVDDVETVASEMNLKCCQRP